MYIGVTTGKSRDYWPLNFNAAGYAIKSSLFFPHSDMVLFLTIRPFFTNTYFKFLFQAIPAGFQTSKVFDFMNCSLFLHAAFYLHIATSTSRFDYDKQGRTVF